LGFSLGLGHCCACIQEMAAKGIGLVFLLAFYLGLCLD